MGVGADTFVFCYGSLLNRASLARALGRDIAAGTLRAATLTGYRRTWDAAAPVLVPQPGGASDATMLARFLDLQPAPGATVNGALAWVSQLELAGLRVREAGYGEHDVSAAIAGAPPDARVLTFAGQREGAHAGEIVLAEYIALVESGCAELGADFLAEFRRTTAPIDAPLVTGPYRFADPAQNALTTWGKRA